MNTRTQTPQHNPAITALLCLMFALPWSDGSIAQILTISLMFLIFTVAVLWHYRKNTFSTISYLKKQHPLALFLFSAWIISSSLSLLLVLAAETSSFHKFMAAYRHISILLYVLYVFALARFCRINRLSHIRIFSVLIAGVITLLILYLLTYYFGPDPQPGIWALYPPLGSHVRNIGNVAAVCCVVSTLIVVNRVFASNIRHYLILASILPLWSFLVWNGGRSSMAATLLTSILVMLLSLVFAKADLRRCLLVLAIIASGSFIGDRLSVFQWNGLQRAASINEMSATESNVMVNDQFTSGRMTIWTISLNAFKAAPWFGLGPYGYYFIPDKTDDDQPHNLLVQFLVEWGIIGTSLMLALLAYCAWQGLKTLPAAFREDDFSYITGAAVVFLLTLDGLTAGTYFKLLPMICLTTAFAVFPFGRRHGVSDSTP